MLTQDVSEMPAYYRANLVNGKSLLKEQTISGLQLQKHHQGFSLRTFDGIFTYITHSKIYFYVVMMILRH